MCSYSCMREFDKRKEERTMKKITLEEKKKAVAIAMEGKNPLEYLKSIGVRNASQSWQSIRKYCEANDPETFARLPETMRKKAEPKKEPEKPAELPKVKVEELVHVKMPDAPIIVDEFQVTAIRSDKYGEFYYDKDHNCIDWRNGYGDEVSLTPGGWADLAEDLPKILWALGVKA